MSLFGNAGAKATGEDYCFHESMRQTQIVLAEARVAGRLGLMKDALSKVVRGGDPAPSPIAGFRKARQPGDPSKDATAFVIRDQASLWRAARRCLRALTEGLQTNAIKRSDRSVCI